MTDIDPTPTHAQLVEQFRKIGKGCDTGYMESQEFRDFCETYGAAMADKSFDKLLDAARLEAWGDEKP